MVHLLEAGPNSSLALICIGVIVVNKIAFQPSFHLHLEDLGLCICIIIKYFCYLFKLAYQMVCFSVKVSYIPCLYWSSLPSSQFLTFPALLHVLQWPNVFYDLSSRDSYSFSRSAGSFNVSGNILKSGLFWIEENRYNFIFWHMYISFSRNHLLKMLFFF